MAVVPICFKIGYKDQNDQEVFGGVSLGLNHTVRTGCVCFDSVGFPIKSKTRVPKCASHVRHISATTSEKEKLSRTQFSLESSSRQKQLRSLDSYFGKSKQSSPSSLNNDRDSDNRSGQMRTDSELKDQVSSATNTEATEATAFNARSRLKVDGQERSKTEYDEASGLYMISTMASINIAVYLFEIASPIKNSDLGLFSLPSLYGAKINHLILYGEWWRLLTPMFLHTGILHIGLGCWALLTFGPRVCKAYGPFTFFFIYVLGGLSGNLTSFLHTPDPTVGGTGPVFAVIGAWLIYQYQNRGAIGKDVCETMYQKAIVVTALGFVLSAFGPIDDWTHFGSTFTGVVYGFLTCPTLQIDDLTSESRQEEGIALIGRNVDPCKSLLLFSVFILVLSSLLLIFEPPLGSVAVDGLV